MSAQRPAPIEAWLETAQGGDLAGLDALLADDVAFLSPVVHTPQRGKALTAKYLAAAIDVLGANFRIVEEWIGPRSAVLEFVSAIDGVEINGVDIIGWNDQGRIDRFKVMVRPIRAVEALRERMAAALGLAPPKGG